VKKYDVIVSSLALHHLESDEDKNFNPAKFFYIISISWADGVYEVAVYGR